MQTKITYRGTLNGVQGLWCGFKPEGLEVEQEIPVYYPDKNKVFVKDNVEYSVVVLKDGESILDYTERDKIENIGE